jgi:hypothetical protein
MAGAVKAAKAHTAMPAARAIVNLLRPGCAISINQFPSFH